MIVILDELILKYLWEARDECFLESLLFVDWNQGLKAGKDLSNGDITFLEFFFVIVNETRID